MSIKILIVPDIWRHCNATPQSLYLYSLLYLFNYHYKRQLYNHISYYSCHIVSRLLRWVTLFRAMRSDKA